VESIAHATLRAFGTAAAQLQHALYATHARNAEVRATGGSGRLRAEVTALITAVDDADKANGAVRDGLLRLLAQLGD
jgi:hypothetical protein